MSFLRPGVLVIVCCSRRISSRLCLALLMTTALAFAAWAEAVGVAATGPLFVSPAGNDANDCQTLATACRTIGAAIGKASAGDLIIVATGTYTENLTIDKDLSVIGAGPEATAINGGGVQRVITVPATIHVSLIDLSVVNGNVQSPDHGGGILVVGALTLNRTRVGNNANAGIYVSGTLNADQSMIVGNERGIWNYGTTVLSHMIISSNLGSGVANFGAMTLDHALVMSNTNLNFGGGVFQQQGVMTISESTILGNVAGGCLSDVRGLLDYWNNASMRLEQAANRSDACFYSGGGGLYAYSGSVALSGSTIAGNRAGDEGAGVWNAFAALSLMNDTVSGNASNQYGGGISNHQILTLTNVAVSDNSAAWSGGGIYNLSVVRSLNTIVANSFKGGNCYHGIISLGHNLSSDGSCALNATGDLTNTDPLLGPLQDNGGPTPTQALLPGSPAINAGDNDGCPAADQRGIPRPQAGICDIGAYEYVFPLKFFLPLVAR